MRKVPPPSLKRTRTGMPLQALMSFWEERRVTLGRAESEQTLLVVHTLRWIEPTGIKVRIISARKADQRDEIRDYENAPR